MQLKWWQKIISIPAAVLIYLFLIDFLSSSNIFVSSLSQTQDMGGALNIGFGQAVGVSVTRPYFFGMLRLPIYSGAIGDIGFYHNIFFNFFIYIYAAAMILWTLSERFELREKKNWKKAYKGKKQKVKGGKIKWRI